MSFLSAISEMKLDQNLFMKLEIPNVLGKIFSAFKQLFNTVATIAHRLSNIEKLGIEENWTYQTNPITGISILKVEKDPMAVKKTRNALKDLFQ